MDYVLFTKYIQMQLVILVLSYIITRIGQDNTDYKYLQKLVKIGLLKDNFTPQSVKWIPGYKYHLFNLSCKKIAKLNPTFKPAYIKISILIHLRLIVLIIAILISSLGGAYINEVTYFLLSLVEVLVWFLIMTLPLIALHYMHKVINKKVYKLHKDYVETLEVNYQIIDKNDTL